ncbi:MAG: hypothetical protein GY746_11055, partial [Gammaproteobacteria bacterium]|nr:hypothetical protein [Gammaproteobacteria bacterium]
MSYPTLTNLINAIRIANEATSLSQAIINSGPEWFWRLDETSGTIALDEMGNKNLTYESDASTADCSIAASGDKFDGYSKDINADSALQIFEAGGAPAPTYCQQQDPTDYVARWELENIVTDQTDPSDYVMYFPFNSDPDDVVQSRVFTIVDSPTYISGKTNNAISFTTSDYTYSQNATTRGYFSEQVFSY